MASTYTPIATYTLGSATATVTFSSIPSTYTDLVLVASYSAATNSTGNSFTFNNDTGTNYSNTTLFGNGTNPGSQIVTNQTGIQGFYYSFSEITTGIINIMNYSNTTTYKSCLVRSADANGYIIQRAGLWRSTAAINRLDITNSGGNFATGSTFTLYGILSA